MEKIKKKKGLTGTPNEAIQEYEICHRVLSRDAAVQGMVLLKNENQVLPLKKGCRIALFGSGAVKTVKGGTGSGDVNERDRVSIWQGLMEAGFKITTGEWLEAYEIEYKRERSEWREDILNKMSGAQPSELFQIYCSTPFNTPLGGSITKTDTETAIYVISRISGEGADRYYREGDYLLNEEEKTALKELCQVYENVVVILNTGGVIDVSFLDEYKAIRGLLQIMQPGMEGGHAVADILSGDRTPSGKLTDTWAYNYKDYPGSESFSHNNGNTLEDYYSEGIYVGYRYFDSFDKKARFPFGFGLSYTDFSIDVTDIELKQEENENPEIRIKANVANTGDTYSGREVVQIYVSLPADGLEKEYRRLAGFGKTRELKPGEHQNLTITFPLYQMASYDEREPGWILDPGFYGIWAGNSLVTAKIEGMIELSGRAVMVRTEHICSPFEKPEELSVPLENRKRKYSQWLEEAKVSGTNILSLDCKDIITQTILYTKDAIYADKESTEFTERLTKEQLIALAAGEPSGGQDSNLGSSGIKVPGSAGETSSCAQNINLPGIILADGPAGLRLVNRYQVDEGRVVPNDFFESLEGGILSDRNKERKGISYYQYCTSIPVGTLLAQSWDMDLLNKVGEMIAWEMQEFCITLWLAPGMNIHRNPLCGRNFEYYSEDPLLSGMAASSITMGVQKALGCGTTIKHFACNNQEDDRMLTDVIISERALREIYLKGFEIAIKNAQPMAMMTSYNKINGIHAANHFDLCTKAARCEWGFEGMIMTDWTTTHHGPECTAAGCMRAGNDLIMPGITADHENLKEELEAGTLTLEAVKECVARTVRVIQKSNREKV